MQTTSLNSSWQRSSLGYKERFVDDFEYNGIRVRQFPCRAVFEKAAVDAFGSGFVGVDRDSERCDNENDVDRVPDTAFTVWDSSILLGVYASREDVCKRLTRRRTTPSTTPIVTLELGAGAGVASLLFARSEYAKNSLRSFVMVVTDLPGTINFTKLNMQTNIGKVHANTTLVTKPLRWGRIEDIEALPVQIRLPDIVLGADLLYTCDKTVICALAETVTLLAKKVVVFAVCKQHRPESITFFLSLVRESFEIKHVPASMIHETLLASDEDFGIIELWRKRRRK
eukprot:CCRYP_014837-RA/>CCRYP_014837-RA protein AED:0.07 eAED:0.07 QI:0/-1/0/1/-1/1/1/0/283